MNDFYSTLKEIRGKAKTDLDFSKLLTEAVLSRKIDTMQLSYLLLKWTYPREVVESIDVYLEEKNL
jgi:hypothetical protein